MATNEILPFAATSTNILSQSAYASDPQRLIGHQPGIARDVLENKALKQSSIMAAGVAQFIADNQASAVTDSLVPSVISSYLGAAVVAVASGGGAVTPANIQNKSFETFDTAGTSTAYTMTPSPAIGALTANQQLIGKFHTAAGLNPTMAWSGLAAVGLKYYTSTGAKAFVTATQVPNGWVSRLYYDGVDIVALDTPQSSGLGASSLASSGYQVLSSGLIMQWGTYTITASNTVSITYPMAFTTATYSVGAFAMGVASTQATSTSAVTASGFNVIINGTNTGSGFWVAFGK